jgi:hypothetical protein
MQKPEMAATELRRCVVDLGLAGVQIGTHINEWNLDAPELYPVWEVRNSDFSLRRALSRTFCWLRPDPKNYLFIYRRLKE